MQADRHHHSKPGKQRKHDRPPHGISARQFVREREPAGIFPAPTRDANTTGPDPGNRKSNRWRHEILSIFRAPRSFKEVVISKAPLCNYHGIVLRSDVAPIFEDGNAQRIAIAGTGRVLMERDVVLPDSIGFRLLIHPGAMPDGVLAFAAESGPKQILAVKSQEVVEWHGVIDGLQQD